MSAHDRKVEAACWAAYGPWNLSDGGVRCRLLSEPVIGPESKMPAQNVFWLAVKGVPSRIRTCAPGSGGRCSIP